MKIIRNSFLLLFILISICSCSYKYYVVRHAEKEIGGQDPDLSPIGYQRADALKEELLNQKIKQIYSTNTKRTMQTAKPLSDAINVPIKNYGAVPDALFLDFIQLKKKNTLIVGHSNTVDEIVNGLTGEEKLKDLEDKTYDRLYIITVKGKKKTFEEKSYGN
ncbi:MAG: SixA phosphatase family protein [Flavitalea sp.]